MVKRVNAARLRAACFAERQKRTGFELLYDLLANATIQIKVEKMRIARIWHKEANRIRLPATVKF